MMGIETYDSRKRRELENLHKADFFAEMQDIPEPYRRVKLWDPLNREWLEGWSIRTTKHQLSSYGQSVTVVKLDRGGEEVVLSDMEIELYELTEI